MRNVGSEGSITNMSTKPRSGRESPKVITIPPDLLTALETFAGNIGIPRNAALILAARKGLQTLAEEYTTKPPLVPV